MKEAEKTAGKAAPREDLVLCSEGEYLEWSPPAEPPLALKPPLLTEEEFSAWWEAKLQKMPEDERRELEQGMRDLYSFGFES